MRSPVLLITGDSGLDDRLRERLDVSHAVSNGRMPSDVLVVDLSAASPSIWDHLQRLSHEKTRPSIILLDDDTASREHLASVAADGLVPLDARITEMTDRIEEHTCDHAFRVVANHIRADATIPHPLVRFLSAAFTERCGRVKVLARSLGTSQSTVRSQWRAFRSDPSLRLEDVLHRVAVLRERAGKEDVDWRSDLHKLADSISAGAT